MKAPLSLQKESKKTRVDKKDTGLYFLIRPCCNEPLVLDSGEGSCCRHFGLPVWSKYWFQLNLAIYRKFKGFEGIWGLSLDELKHLRADVETQSSAISTSSTVTSTWTKIKVLCHHGISWGPCDILISEEHLATMQGWHFPVTLRLPACVFFPRKLRVALRMQLWKKSLSFYLVGWNILPTDRWGPSRTTAMGFESLHW